MNRQPMNSINPMGSLNPTPAQVIQSVVAPLKSAAAVAAIKDFETVTEHAPAAPKSTHTIVPVRQLEVGDLIFFHMYGHGPFRVDSIRTHSYISSHKILTGSSYNATDSAKCRYNSHEAKAGTWNDPIELPHQFTNGYQPVELWEDDKTRASFGLPKVSKREIETLKVSLGTDEELPEGWVRA